MTTQEVAARLHKLCNEGKYGEAHVELYSADVTSTEPNREGQRETVFGLDALKAKAERLQSMVEEFHGVYACEPMVFGNYIFMEMGFDATMKGMGRQEMKEMAEYEVKDGKIVSEAFFF